MCRVDGMGGRVLCPPFGARCHCFHLSLKVTQVRPYLLACMLIRSARRPLGLLLSLFSRCARLSKRRRFLNFPLFHASMHPCNSSAAHLLPVMLSCVAEMLRMEEELLKLELPHIDDGAEEESGEATWRNACELVKGVVGYDGYRLQRRNKMKVGLKLLWVWFDG